jgi:ABC-type lipoprotein release transport system permease subunit
MLANPLRTFLSIPGGVTGAAALVVGLVFETWPARRAAGLSPVKALRDE